METYTLRTDTLRSPNGCTLQSPWDQDAIARCPGPDSGTDAEYPGKYDRRRFNTDNPFFAHLLFTRRRPLSGLRLSQEETMKLKFALVGLLTLGGAALATGAASAMPLAPLGQSPIANAETVALVCGPNGCVRTVPRYGSGYGVRRGGYAYGYRRGGYAYGYRRGVRRW
jgi:hypothetical protein